MYLVYICASLVVFTTANALSIQPFPRPWDRCGPVCMIACPFGNEIDSRGCPLCRCREPYILPTFRPPIGPDRCGPTCMIHCEYGRIIDSRGCPTCQCRGPRNCPYRRRCGRFCPMGMYAQDPFGCQTCDCLMPSFKI